MWKITIPFPKKKYWIQFDNKIVFELKTKKGKSLGAQNKEVRLEW